mmetsp:Transcript_31302/g.88736  ORF Transcript_31302/g.88736 Transcript_31302/m.88736 type:complete len:443 (-) Transcript_31302:403-1731(-)
MGRGEACDVAGGGSPKRRKLVGCKNFERSNPKSDKFDIQRFHHVELWCADATNTSRRFSHGLGMPIVARTDQSTSNSLYASYTLKSNELVFVFTSPYSTKCVVREHKPPMPWNSADRHWDFLKKHGMGVRALGIRVGDVTEAWKSSTANGARGVLPPTKIEDSASGTSQEICEVELYGDVVLRFVCGSFQGPGIAGGEPMPIPEGFQSFGLERLDHAVGNVHDLMEQIAYMESCFGLHEFAEFTAEEVGTVNSGLNSMVMANNSEFVLMPINEPTFGTKVKSQIQTFLEQNEGPGLQHLALKTDNIFQTMRAMRSAGLTAGFDFMPRPSDGYYQKLPGRIGEGLTAEQYTEIEELGLLADKDDQGVLLQIFTKPVGDRPTLFLEIIQRVGCMQEEPPAAKEPETPEPSAPKLVQASGCGGFGKGNFSELFKSIEEYEKTLGV